MKLRVSIREAAYLFNDVETVEIDQSELYQFIKHLNDEYQSQNGIILNWNTSEVDSGEVDVTVTIYNDYME
ncbi:hypothetical protein [Staphylococcus sp. LKG3-3]|uniref:hypothetical protein n=1 Tax=Staphylococcus sp. LKG3-3 TaxID=3399685 RepID=UPI003D49CB22